MIRSRYDFCGFSFSTFVSEHHGIIDCIVSNDNKKLVIADSRLFGRPTDYYSSFDSSVANGFYFFENLSIREKSWVADFLVDRTEYEKRILI